MSNTYAYVVLDLSPTAYEEIADKLREAGYDHAFHKDGEGNIVLDMNGIAVGKEAAV